MAVTIDTSFSAAEQAVEGTKTVVNLGGKQFTIVDEPPAGAIVVFSRRMQQDTQQQLGAVLELLEKWIVPEEHNELFDVVGSMQTSQLTSFLETDLAAAIQQVAARPM